MRIERFRNEEDIRETALLLSKYSDHSESLRKPERFEEKIKTERARHYQLLFEGKIVGTIGIDRFEGLIQDFCIHPDFRRKKFGTKLLRFAVDFLLCEMRIPHLWIREGNIPMENLAQKLRFQPTGARSKRIDGKWAREWIYSFNLPAK